MDDMDGYEKWMNAYKAAKTTADTLGKMGASKPWWSTVKRSAWPLLFCGVSFVLLWGFGMEPLAALRWCVAPATIVVVGLTLFATMFLVLHAVLHAVAAASLAVLAEAAAHQAVRHRLLSTASRFPSAKELLAALREADRSAGGGKG